MRFILTILYAWSTGPTVVNNLNWTYWTIQLYIGGYRVYDRYYDMGILLIDVIVS